MTYAFPTIAGHNTQTFTFPVGFQVDGSHIAGWNNRNGHRQAHINTLVSNFNKCMAGAPNATPPIPPQPMLAYAMVFRYQPNGQDSEVALQQALSGNKMWPNQPADGTNWAALIAEFDGGGGSLPPAQFQAMVAALGLTFGSS